MGSAFPGRILRPPTVAEKPVEDMGLARPGFLQGSSGDAPGGIPQGQRHHHHVVERADDREELGDEVDGREHPQTSEGHDQLGSPWDPRVTAETSDGDRTGRQESGKVLQHPRGEPPGQQKSRRK